jgi:ABC-type Fe3+-hydroxamate transport system substrate-binding protein
MRLVSLVPSITHTLAELGVSQHIVGCTKFCIEPVSLRHHCTDVGGTKDPDHNLIRSLKPDLVLVNPEENRAEDIQKLEKSYPVLSTYPKNVDDVTSMISEIAAHVDQPQKGSSLISSLNEARAKVTQLRRPLGRYIYLIWRNPYFAVGPDTYISNFLSLGGFENALKNFTEHYPVITPAQILELGPDRIFLSSEPYAFRARHKDMLLKELGPDTPIEITKIDGMLCSWHGAKTIDALQEFAKYLEGEETELLSTFSTPIDSHL